MVEMDALQRKLFAKVVTGVGADKVKEILVKMKKCVL